MKKLLMNKSKDNAGNYWPTAQQELLLYAIFKQDKKAVEAWSEWQAKVDLNKLDAGSYRLLPLLYRNLQSQGIDHHLMSKFKEIYRNTWCQNQLLFHHVTDLLLAFHTAGIRKILLLKGAALNLFYYKDYGLRPMTHFDVFIHTEQAANVLNLLKERHWIATFFSLKSLEEKHIAALIYRKCSWGFKDNAGNQFNLHWHVLYNCLANDVDNDFLANAVSIDLSNMPLYILNPTDQLLHTCAQELQWEQLPSICWIADAMMIFRTAQIDWERLLIHAKQCCSVLPLRDTLNYLGNKMDISIPSNILQALQNTDGSI